MATATATAARGGRAGSAAPDPLSPATASRGEAVEGTTSNVASADREEEQEVGRAGDADGGEEEERARARPDELRRPTTRPSFPLSPLPPRPYLPSPKSQKASRRLRQRKTSRLPRRRRRGRTRTSPAAKRSRVESMLGPESQTLLHLADSSSQSPWQSVQCGTFDMRSSQAVGRKPGRRNDATNAVKREATDVTTSRPRRSVPGLLGGERVRKPGCIGAVRPSGRTLGGRDEAHRAN